MSILFQIPNLAPTHLPLLQCPGTKNEILDRECVYVCALISFVGYKISEDEYFFMYGLFIA